MPQQQRVVVQRGGPVGSSPQGFIGSTYATLTSADNAAIVRSLLAFGAGVAIFSSSWAELLLPPYAEPPIFRPRLLFPGPFESWN
ncbi:related to component of translocase of the outer mitochondrial membrane complex [Cephalotrichum gorgonifer]|uniref:Related to component of translocase of the outer mitochondrial membrane complex n=1 Tax=Cephalotrichum gorgonifer TaxID=2041049 RepID=A0AAE8MUY2_9PEZI|nr:related to component of translocase of the outer mitochondrial membrane complex [Cephalotrichum gorgonifer]